jgi:trypsin-like peptidase
VGRIVAVIAAGLALLAELLWISGSFFGNVTQPIMMPAARKKHQQPFHLSQPDTNTVQAMFGTHQAGDEDGQATRATLSALFQPYLSSVWSVGPVPSASGTAFVVDDGGWLATTARAVKDARVADNIGLCRSIGGYYIGARLVFRDYERDVAILQTNGPAGKPLKLSTDIIYTNDEIILHAEVSLIENVIILRGGGQVESGTLVEARKTSNDFAGFDDFTIKLPSGPDCPGAPALNIGGTVLGMRAGGQNDDKGAIFLPAARVSWALDQAKNESQGA